MLFKPLISNWKIIREGLINYTLVDYSRVLHTCMGLLTCKFTITHPSVVAVTTVTQVHMPLRSTVVNIEVVSRVICY